MRELYGTAIMFFYFLKWPIIIGLPILYKQGLHDNIILNILWVYCIILALKDFFIMGKKYLHKKRPEE